MRSVIITFIFSAIISTQIFAQDINTAKTFFQEGKLDKAKTSIDAVIKGTAAASPEAWIWKYKIYNGITKNAAYVNIAPNASQEAFEAIRKSYDMPGGTEALIKEFGVVYTTTFNDYYANFINSGSGKMNKKDFAGAYEDFRSALSVSALFYKNKIITIDLDTLLTFYAGYCAMQNKDDRNAEFYFKKLVDRSAYSNDVQIAYGWLCNYYLVTKKDIQAAKAVYDKGIKLYPTDEYLRSKGIEITRAGKNMDELFKQYEEALLKPGAGYIDYLSYGADLYDYLFVTEDNHTITNATTRRERMKEVLLKALQLKPASAEANYILGMSYTSIAMEINKQSATAAAEKKAELNKNADVAANNSITYLEKAVTAYNAKTSLTAADKDHLKASLQQLINLYNFLQQPERSKATREKLDKL